MYHENGPPIVFDKMISVKFVLFIVTPAKLQPVKLNPDKLCELKLVFVISKCRSNNNFCSICDLYYITIFWYHRGRTPSKLTNLVPFILLFNIVFVKFEFSKFIPIKSCSVKSTPDKFIFGPITKVFNTPVPLCVSSLVIAFILELKSKELLPLLIKPKVVLFNVIFAKLVFETRAFVKSHPPNLIFEKLQFFIVRFSYLNFQYLSQYHRYF